MYKYIVLVAIGASLGLSFFGPSIEPTLFPVTNKMFINDIDIVGSKLEFDAYIEKNRQCEYKRPRRLCL